MPKTNESIIFTKDKDSLVKIGDILTNYNVSILTPKDTTSLIRVVSRVKPFLIILDIKELGNNFLKITNKIMVDSLLSNIIVMIDNKDEEMLDHLLLLKRPLSLIEKPINNIDFNEKVSSILAINKEILELKENQEFLFEAYNQLEFLITIIFNDYENDTTILSRVINLFLQSPDNYDLHEKGLNLLSSVYHNNIRFIKRFSLMRELNDISEDEFTQLDIFTIIAPIIEDLKTSMVFNIILDKQFLPGKFVTFGVSKLLKDLFSEVIYSLTMPETSFCKELTITLKKSSYLTDENDIKIPSIEIALCSIIDKLNTDKNGNSNMNPTFQEYGFGYFFMKELVGNFNGRILIKDVHKEKHIETTMTIVLPENKK